MTSLPDAALLLIAMLGLIHVWRGRWQRKVKWEQLMKDEK